MSNIASTHHIETHRGVNLPPIEQPLMMGNVGDKVTNCWFTVCGRERYLNATQNATAQRPPRCGYLVEYGKLSDMGGLFSGSRLSRLKVTLS